MYFSLIKVVDTKGRFCLSWLLPSFPAGGKGSDSDRLKGKKEDLRRSAVSGPGGGGNSGKLRRYGGSYAILGEHRLTDTARAAMDGGVTSHQSGDC